MRVPRAGMVLSVAAVLLLFGCIGETPPSPLPNASRGTVTNNNTDGSAGAGNAMTKEMCENARGHWDECGSACRGAPPGTACIMMCVQYCECGGIAGFGCPAGYECADYLPSNDTPDAMGICKRTS